MSEDWRERVRGEAMNYLYEEGLNFVAGRLYEMYPTKPRKLWSIRWAIAMWILGLPRYGCEVHHPPPK